MTLSVPCNLDYRCARPGFANRSLGLVCSAATHPVVLIENGRLTTAPATAQELLSQQRNWSYTTALVRDSYLVVDWKLHLERLLRNVKLLGRQHAPVYASLLAWIDEQELSDDAAVDELDTLVSPQAAQALRHLAGGQAQQQDQNMLVVVLKDRENSQHSEPPSSSGPPVSVLVWVKQAPPASCAPATVLVAGDHRPLAQAKHCDWVVARQPLEQLKREAAADEVILSNGSGELLEGLASNWYVIADGCQLTAESTPAAAGQQPEYSIDTPATAAGAAAESRRSSGNSGGLVLLTTGPQHAALLGVTQQRVLEAAAAVNLKILQQPARLQQRHTWREAFITNCLRGIQPVSAVLDAPGRVIWAEPEGSGTATAELQQALDKIQTLSDMQQYL